ncbi:MAG: DMT family transporter [Gammaproteobacteria bacterium]|nr:DMT family transporter [Gammaproteobacteria bacterium]
MNTTPITLKTKFALGLALTLWASAFVGIRYGLVSYSPGPLALFRFIIASFCLLILCIRLPKNRQKINGKDLCWLLVIGAITLSIYHVCLNYGELTVSSGIASFIISQSPVITTLLAILFLGERINVYGILGLLISVFGVTLIMLGQSGALKFETGCLFVLASTVSGSVFSVLQKHFLKKYHSIEVTAYVVLGGAIGMLFYLPRLIHEMPLASTKATIATVYLGIFPAGIAYLAWSYALSKLSASRTMNFIYVMPLMTTIMGWIFLGEVPALMALIGGLVALVGVWVVSCSDRI